MQNRGTKAFTETWPPLCGPASGRKIPGSEGEALRQPPGLCLQSPSTAYAKPALLHPEL